ncbi:MAG TPA: hypothetical protein DCZ03_00680 [Gammaproteobacteria bacterium]|nr:hypothetical protein [Gammaproteobacteria bacterium]
MEQTPPPQHTKLISTLAMNPNNHKDGLQTSRTYQSFSSVLTGILIILFGSIIVSVPLSQLTRYFLSQQGKTTAEIELYFEQQFSHPQFVLIGLFFNLVVLFFAGWSTGKLAPYLPVWHGLVVAILGSLFFMLPTINQVPIWYSLILLLSTFSLCCFGAVRSKHGHACDQDRN